MMMMEKMTYLSKRHSERSQLQYQRERKNMLNTETIIYRIINLDNELLKEINYFILRYPLMVKGTTLAERQQIILSFCTELYVKLRKINTYSIMEEQRLFAVLERMVQIRLYPYIYQPSIHLLESIPFNSINTDNSMTSINKVHSFINLRHLGLTEKEIPFYSDIILFLKRVDSLRSPNDKLQCLKGILQLIEEIAKMSFTINDKQMLLRYFVIKSQISHLSSTLQYINVFSTNPMKEEIIKEYSSVIDYCSSLDRKSLYISDEQYAIEMERYSSQIDILFESVPIAISDIQLLNLMNFTQNKQAVTVDHLFHMNVEDIQKEDVAIIIDLIKRLNKENIDLKKYIDSHK